MEIKINVDRAELSKELSEIVKSLSAKDKKAMIKEVVTNYYSDYENFCKDEKKLLDQEMLAIARSKMNQWDKRDFDTDARVRGHRYYTEQLKDHPALAERTRKEISKSIISELSKHINEQIKTDESYKALVAESMAAIKQLFPLMVQNALISHMANQLPSLVNDINNSMGNLQEQINQIHNNLQLPRY